MSISHRVLGQADRDNALLVTIDSGQHVERVLFDCGDHCLDMLSFGEIQAIDHLCMSHLHMDHVGGFDSFFRCNYGRESKPNHIWGPPRTSQIMQHRFQGFMWNLHAEMNGSWLVHDFHPGRIDTSRFELSEAFAMAHPEQSQPCPGPFLEARNYNISAIEMDHLTPSMAYVVNEKPKLNVDTAKAASMGLRPGPWMKELKDPASTVDEIEVGGKVLPLPQLRAELLLRSEGDCICYLTDFLLNDEVIDQLVPSIQGCKTMVCEAQYRHADEELARKHRHMTVTYSAKLAKAAGVGELILFHLSDRYPRAEHPEILAEAQAIFPNSRFPEGWLKVEG